MLKQTLLCLCKLPTLFISKTQLYISCISTFTITHLFETCNKKNKINRLILLKHVIVTMLALYFVSNM